MPYEYQQLQDMYEHQSGCSHLEDVLDHIPGKRLSQAKKSGSKILLTKFSFSYCHPLLDIFMINLSILALSEKKNVLRVQRGVMM